MAWGFRVSLDAALLYRATRLRSIEIRSTLPAFLFVAVMTILAPLIGLVVGGWHGMP